MRRCPTAPLPPPFVLMPLQMLSKVEGPTSKAIKRGAKLGVANVPKQYRVKSGAQLE